MLSGYVDISDIPRLCKCLVCSQPKQILDMFPSYENISISVVYKYLRTSKPSCKSVFVTGVMDPTPATHIEYHETRA